MSTKIVIGIAKASEEVLAEEAVENTLLPPLRRLLRDVRNPPILVISAFERKCITTAHFLARAVHGQLALSGALSADREACEASARAQLQELGNSSSVERYDGDSARAFIEAWNAASRVLFVVPSAQASEAGFAAYQTIHPFTLYFEPSQQRPLSQVSMDHLLEAVASGLDGSNTLNNRLGQMEDLMTRIQRRLRELLAERAATSDRSNQELAEAFEEVRRVHTQVASLNQRMHELARHFAQYIPREVPDPGNCVKITVFYYDYNRRCCVVKVQNESDSYLKDVKIRLQEHDVTFAKFLMLEPHSAVKKEVSCDFSDDYYSQHVCAYYKNQLVSEPRPISFIELKRLVEYESKTGFEYINRSQRPFTNLLLMCNTRLQPLKQIQSLPALTQTKEVKVNEPITAFPDAFFYFMSEHQIVSNFC